MSLAWGGVVLLLLLLPGFLFFTGLFLPETFTRETAERSALGQLAGSLLVSIVVHAALVAAVQLTCGDSRPCVSFPELVRAITLDGKISQDSAAVASMLDRHWFAIVLYALSASTLGLLGGYGVGANAVRGGFCRLLAQHTWVHKLSVGDSLTIAYVMTSIKEGKQILLYRGFLEAFGLQKTGQFSYLAIKGARRGYMLLDSDGARVTTPEDWHVIGDGPRDSQEVGRRSLNLFVIEGSQIANVVFERFEINYEAVALKDISSMYESFAKELQEAAVREGDRASAP